MIGKLFTPKRYIISLFLAVVLFFAAVPGQREAEARVFSMQDLQTIIAPVALYPDALLSNILVASTVPGEVVQAQYYLNYYGGKVTSMPATDWDPSVKALLYFPGVLNQMNNDLAWTQNLGYTFINQQGDVMRSIQAYRNKAYKAGNLKTNKYQKVKYYNNIYEIMPVSANQYYTPVYNPSSVINPGNSLVDYLRGGLAGNWLNYRTTHWANQAVTVNPTYYSYYNIPAGGYYSGIYGNPGYHGVKVWAPTPRAGKFFHNGTVNNITIINNATSQFQHYKIKYPKQGAPGIGTTKVNKSSVTVAPPQGNNGKSKKTQGAIVTSPQVNAGGNSPKTRNGGDSQPQGNSEKSKKQQGAAGTGPQAHSVGNPSNAGNGGAPQPQGNKGGGGHSQGNKNK